MYYTVSLAAILQLGGLVLKWRRGLGYAPTPKILKITSLEGAFPAISHKKFV
jgi:hypothetical protein